MTDTPKPAEANQPKEAVEAATTDPATGEAKEAGVAEPAPDPDAVPITIDGRSFSARKGELVIAAVERAGTYIPRFCWHERMSSVGMCRMCLVEVDSGRGPQITVSCMVTVAPDMKVDTASDTTKRMQEGVLEMLLANHPLDCPVCDKGGECPLQDQAYSHGPGESRFVEEKRHFEKPIPISALVNLDRERCILCDRCTRFADEVAGDPLIHFIQRGNETQVMTFPGEPFSSYFSGNTVQICPVGALTAEPYRFKARPWDLTQIESTCTTCSVGCRTLVQASRDELLRYQGVDVDAVNWGWLCDRGRFNFEAVGSPDRLAEPLVRGEGGLDATSWNTAMEAATQLFDDALDAGGGDGVAVLGGARGSNESAYAWAQLAAALGVTHRDAQLGDGLPAAVVDLPRATIDEAAAAATVVLVGPDLKEELPVLYLRLRHAATNNTTKLVELAVADTGLTRHAWRSVRVESGDVAAVTAALSAVDVAEQLGTGPVVVVAGRSNLAESESSAAAMIRAVLDAAPGAKVLPALRRGNVVGALQLGLRPVAEGDQDGLGILAAAAAGRIDLLVLLGVDPIADCPDTDLARRALAGARRVIAIDTFLTDSSSQADVVLAAAAYAEQGGTTTNLEGRVTTLGQKVTPAGTSRPDWMIAAELADRLGLEDLAAELASLEAITDAIAANVPAYAGATRAALAAGADVLAVATGDGGAFGADRPAASERNRYDYRLVVSRRLYDRAVGTAKSPSLAPLVGDVAATIHPLDLDGLGIAAGSDVTLSGPRGSVVMPIAADAAVPRGSVRIPFNAGSSVNDIVDGSAPVHDVHIERLSS